MKTLTARLKNFLSNHTMFVALTSVAILITLATIQPGKFLFGWDVTAPELAISLNLERSIFGVWQTYRGLGTLDGMAHGANIVHVFLMSVWKLVVGIEAARPLWLLLLHATGMIGAGLLTRQLLKSSYTSIDVKNLNLSSLVAGLLYGLNAYVLQMFYVPLEVFAYQFAVLPWLIWSAQRYLTNYSAKALGVFGIITLLGLGQAHVPTVFISSALLLGFVLLWHLFVARGKNLKQVILIGAVFAALNASWFLPYTYSAVHKPEVITSSQINQLSTPEIAARNKAWGTFYGVTTMGSFNMDYLSWSETPDNVGLMMGSWRTHYYSPWYQITTLFLFGLAMYGSAHLMNRGGSARRTATWVPISFFIFFVLLANNSFLFGWITQLLTAGVPFFGEVFRFTFTKFSQPYALLLSILVGVAVAQMLTNFRPNKPNLKWITIGTVFLLIAIHSLPIWRNGLFYQELWVSVPDEYFELADYVNSRATATEKMAILPSPTLYGWTSNTWGHRGSGFLWQMIRPAQLDRAFDAWSTENETYYQQLDTAISGQNREDFFAVLEKYHVEYVLYDDSIVTGSNALQAIENQAVRDWLAETATIEFEEGYLTLYKLNSGTSEAVFLTENIPFYSGSTLRTQQAPIPTPYLEATDNTDLIADRTYPFSYLSRENISLDSVAYADEVLTFSLPNLTQQTQLVLPKPTSGSQLNLPFTVIQTGSEVHFVGQPIGVVSSGEQTTVLENPLHLIHQLTDDQVDQALLLVEVNEQLVTISDEQTNVWLNRLNMNEPIQIQSFLPEQIENNGLEFFVQGAVAESQISSEVWSSIDERVISIEENHATVTLHILSYASQVSLNSGATTENCDVLDRGAVAEQLSENFAIIEASGFANACKGFPLDPATTHDSFFLQITGSTDGENGLIAGIEHWSAPRLISYQLLSPSADKILLSIPGLKLLPEQSSSLIMENRSFSKQTTTAEISRIEVILPGFSREYLEGVFMQAGQSSSEDTSSTQKSVSAKFLTPTQINVSVPSSTRGDETTALVLLQSYDAGWIAFPSYRPWQPLSHAKYNGWANGWLMPTNISRVTILYWPQLLHFAGHAVALVTCVSLAKDWLEQRKSDRLRTSQSI